MNNLNDAAEAAFAAYLTPIAGGQASGQYAVFTGKDPSVKSAPCVIIASDGEENEEEPFHTGNYWVNVSVAVKSPASVDLDAGGEPVDSKAPDLAMVEKIFEAIQVDDLDQLVKTDDFFIFPTAFIFGSPRAGRDAEGIWISELVLKIYCCGRDLTVAP